MNHDTYQELLAVAGTDSHALLLLDYCHDATLNDPANIDIDLLMAHCYQPTSDQMEAQLRFICSRLPDYIGEYLTHAADGEAATWLDSVLYELFKLRHGAYPCVDCMKTARNLNTLRVRRSEQGAVDCRRHHQAWVDSFALPSVPAARSHLTAVK